MTHRNDRYATLVGRLQRVEAALDHRGDHAQFSRPSSKRLLRKIKGGAAVLDALQELGPRDLVAVLDDGEDDCDDADGRGGVKESATFAVLTPTMSVANTNGASIAAKLAEDGDAGRPVSPDLEPLPVVRKGNPFAALLNDDSGSDSD